MSEVVIWVILGIILGLFVDVLRKLYKKHTNKNKKKKKKVKREDGEEGEDDQQESDWLDDDSDEDMNDDGSKTIKDEVLFVKYPVDEVKMVLVVREDLKMTKGKIGAQSGHATLGTFKRVEKWAKESDYWKKVLGSWQWNGQKKICLKVMSEIDLVDIQKKAKENSIPCYIVADAGLTQIKEGSLTVCGIGPAPTRMIDLITGQLKLL